MTPFNRLTIIIETFVYEPKTNWVSCILFYRIVHGIPSNGSKYSENICGCVSQRERGKVTERERERKRKLNIC